MKKWLASTVTAAILLGSVSSSALAFDDLNGVAGADKIERLQARGIVTGVDKDTFAPHEKMTAQQAIPLIVKSLDLSLAAFTFIKQPLASDYFTKIPDDAWYADAFVIAQVNGLPIDKDINPNEPVSREQFVQWLMSAIATKGDYAFIEIYMMLEDEKQVSEGYMDAVQKALIAGIAELDADQKFRPKEPITRAEAAVMAHHAIDFVESAEPVPHIPTDPIEDPIRSGEITAETEDVTGDVKKLTLSWGEKPHAGWAIRIEGIDFLDDDTAVVRYSLKYPDPAALYAQVITEPKAETYLDASIVDIRYELVGTTDREPDPDASTNDGKTHGFPGAGNGSAPSKGSAE